MQAIVQAFGLDERTVADWRERAGVHCQKGHQESVEQGQLDLMHVQADAHPSQRMQADRLDGTVRRVGVYGIPALRRRRREQRF